jgi:hypothetical protein
MSLTDIQNKIVTDIQGLVNFNNTISTRAEALLSAHNNLLADGNALLQQIQNAGIPVPAVVTTAAAALANEQPAMTAYAARISGINTALDQVLADVQIAIAPAPAKTA